MDCCWDSIDGTSTHGLALQTTSKASEMGCITRIKMLDIEQTEKTLYFSTKSSYHF